MWLNAFLDLVKDDTRFSSRDTPPSFWLLGRIAWVTVVTWIRMRDVGLLLELIKVYVDAADNAFVWPLVE